MEERVQQLESEIVEINQSIAQLRHQIEEKRDELKEMSRELAKRTIKLNKKESELKIRQSEALQNLESNTGMYVKVHYIVKENPEDEDCPRGVEVYLVGRLGKLDTRELVAPIENCVSISKNIINHNVIFNADDNYNTKITADMIDNPSVSIEFFTKKEADRFILKNVPTIPKS